MGGGFLDVKEIFAGYDEEEILNHLKEKLIEFEKLSKEKNEKGVYK